MLFAAHCVEYKRNIITACIELFFRFQNNLDDRSMVSEIIVHPDWDALTKPYEADIAIAILKEPVEFSTHVTNICLNSPTNSVDDNFIGKKAFVCWKNTTVPIVDRDECKESPVLREIYSDTLFCAGRTDNAAGLCKSKKKNYRQSGWLCTMFQI